VIESSFGNPRIHTVGEPQEFWVTVLAAVIASHRADKFGASSMKRQMRIEHAAAWVSDLERASSYYERWFQATRGPKYLSTKRPFTSYFLSIGSGARLELMESPAEAPRMAHIAISVGSREAVDSLIVEMEAAGVAIVSGPRVTGDGYYEAVVIDSEGNLVEITP
jgi:lactoylglutathione lyase